MTMCMCIDTRRRLIMNSKHTWLSSEIELLRFFLVRLVTRYRICQKMGDANMSPLRALDKLDPTRAPSKHATSFGARGAGRVEGDVSC